MRRGSIVQLVAIAIVAAVIASLVAIFVPGCRPRRARRPKRIHFVYWFATVICIGVFSVVASVLAYSILKFRAGPDDDSDGPPIHGHTKLEIVWTAIPAVLVTAISIVSAIVLAQNSKAGSDPLVVKVTAEQFAWKFTYPNGKTYGFLDAAEGPAREARHHRERRHPLVLGRPSSRRSRTPCRASTTRSSITPTRPGTFPVICTELCGLGHSLMRSHVTIVEPAAFDAFLKRGGQRGRSAGARGLPAERLRQLPHASRRRGATGTIGPDLDKLKQQAAQANRGPLDAFIEESIVKPDAYIEPGFQRPDAAQLRHADPARPARRNSCSIWRGRAQKMTTTEHARHPPPRRAAAADRHPPLDRARAGCASSG